MPRYQELQPQQEPGNIANILPARRQSLAKLADTLILARWLSARTVADLGVRGQ